MPGFPKSRTPCLKARCLFSNALPMGTVKLQTNL
jgi:hypothetical protein